MNLIQTLNKEQADKLSAGKTIPDFEPRASSACSRCSRR
jgi:hypothetical protein